MKAKEIIDKVKQTVELAVPFVTGVVGIWSKQADVAAYVAGAGALIVSGLEYAKLFIKE